MGRYLTNNTRVNAAHDAAYRLQQDGFEIGADKVLEMSSGQLVLGGFTSYSNNRVKHARGGNSTVDSYSLVPTALISTTVVIMSMPSLKPTVLKLTECPYDQRWFGTK